MLVFCMLIVDIVLATFQNKWIGAISGLTGLLIVVTVLTFLFGLLLLGMSFAPSSLQNTVDRIERLFEQPRLALVMNGTGMLVWTILSITQTASALSSKACKDPSADTHAKSSKGNNDDFVKKLPSFCHTKKAGAAFCWLIFCESFISQSTHFHADDSIKSDLLGDHSTFFAILETKSKEWTSNSTICTSSRRRRLPAHCRRWRCLRR